MWYNEIVADFHVAEKIKHIITDSAANMKKAFTSLPGYEDESRNEGESYSDDDFTFGLAFYENLLLEHHSCFAHSIQLVVLLHQIV